ncbi:MAG: M48 family metalloprotease [Christensenellaceae bacterium]|nr:M48 family metalloprotease [Christensenellaceae bacterium]
MPTKQRNEIEEIKERVLEKYPSFGAKIFDVNVIASKDIKTAGTNGKEIVYNPDFFAELSDDEKDFVFAHEICHIAFNHVQRGNDKEHQKLWNIATDACINAFLKRDGLEPPKPKPVLDRNGNPVMGDDGKPLMSGHVDIADGLYRNAEAIYDKLVKKQQKQQEEKQCQQNKEGSPQTGEQGQDQKTQNQQQNQPQDKSQPQNQDKQEGQPEKSEQDDEKIGGGLDDIDLENYEGFDDHDIWNEPEKEQKDSGKAEGIKDLLNRIMKNRKPNEKNLDESKSEQRQEKKEITRPVDEAREFERNEIQRDEETKVRTKAAFAGIFETAGIKDPKYVKPVLSWKRLLVKAVEEQEERWVYRRSSKYNPNVRVDDVEVEGRATTEVVLDTSGSISDTLLRGFLLQLVPMFKETDIKVGCFGGNFHGFQELTSKKQVEEFRATRDDDGTNFEAAATAFTPNPKCRTNKIVFTDGQLDGRSSHKQKTKADGVMWLVFGGQANFSPIGGKVIELSNEELEKMKFETVPQQDMGREM